LGQGKKFLFFRGGSCPRKKPPNGCWAFSFSPGGKKNPVVRQKRGEKRGIDSGPFTFRGAQGAGLPPRNSKGGVGGGAPDQKRPIWFPDFWRTGLWIPRGIVPVIFGTFRRAWEKKSGVRGRNSLSRFSGGRGAVTARLFSFALYGGRNPGNDRLGQNKLWQFGGQNHGPEFFCFAGRCGFCFVWPGAVSGGRATGKRLFMAEP